MTLAITITAVAAFHGGSADAGRQPGRGARGQQADPQALLPGPGLRGAPHEKASASLLAENEDPIAQVAS